MKQTAVEVLFEKLWETPKDKLTWYAILKEAKKIDKQQIVDACIYGNRQDFYDGTEMIGKQYYNETFNK